MLTDLQAVLLAALRQPDPGAWLRARAADPAEPLDDDERGWLAACAGNEDGLRIARLVVRKLRLERLLRGDRSLAAAMAADPTAFAARFAAYDRAVAPTAVFPAEEARHCADWERRTERADS